MALVTQAEFARMHQVSRKAVTTWKQRGYLVMEAALVDVEPSNRRLHSVGRAWPQPVTGNMGVAAGNVAARPRPVWPAVDLAEDFDWPARGGVAVGVPDAVSHLSLMAESSTVTMARLILRHLAPEIALPLLDEFYATEMAGAVSVADECDERLPKGLRSWADHPLFNAPAMGVWEWEDAQQAAAEWLAEQNTGG